MKLYEVIFWGSCGDRPNKDTIYLVRAPDFLSAVEEVVTNSSPNNHDGAKIRLAHVVYEIGDDLSLSPEDRPRILRGPYFESCLQSWLESVASPDRRNKLYERVEGGAACCLTRSPSSCENVLSFLEKGLVQGF